MSKFGISGVAAGVIGSAMLLFGTSVPASATVLPSPAVTSPGETAMVEKVQRRSGERARRWDRGRHGPRFRHARPGFRHYHGGYFYREPWWYGPTIGFGFSLPGATFGLGVPSAHVQWCMNRYRTYDPATDTYAPRVGVRARCNSPYN